jgi:hypothetical protein
MKCRSYWQGKGEMPQLASQRLIRQSLTLPCDPPSSSRALSTLWVSGTALRFLKRLRTLPNWNSSGPIVSVIDANSIGEYDFRLQSRHVRSQNCQTKAMARLISLNAVVRGGKSRQQPTSLICLCLANRAGRLRVNRPEYAQRS